MKGRKEEGEQRDWQRIKANQGEGAREGGQTRVESALSSFTAAFNLTKVQLLNPGTPEHEYQRALITHQRCLLLFGS